MLEQFPGPRAGDLYRWKQGVQTFHRLQSGAGSYPLCKEEALQKERAFHPDLSSHHPQLFVVADLLVLHYCICCFLANSMELGFQREMGEEITHHRIYGLNLDFVVGYVAEIHHRTIGCL